MTTIPAAQPAAKPKPPAVPAIRPPAPVRTNRMSLSALVRGKLQRPRRVLLYGLEGIGKSTFAAGAPSPIFITPEPGTDNLDIVRFPQPDGWQDVLDAVASLTSETHDFKTVVIDTLDASEAQVWRYMIDRDNRGRQPDKRLEDIEDYGYGKGYQKALDEWRLLLAALERLRIAKGMNVILLAHSWVKTFKNPSGDDFDRYELKINNKAAGLLKEWSDVVLFADYETYTKKQDGTRKAKGYSTGARVIRTNRTAAWDAKNRLGLPDELPLSWEDFNTAAEAGQVDDPKTIREVVREKAKQMGGEIEKKALAWMEQAGDDTTVLAQIVNRLTAKLAEKEQG